MSKVSILRLTPLEMMFFSGDPGKTGFKARVHTRTVFSSYELTGSSTTEGILLQLNTISLSKTVKCISNQTKSLILQLVKTGSEVCLRFVMKQVSSHVDSIGLLICNNECYLQPSDSNAGTRDVTHDVPIELVTKRDVLDRHPLSGVLYELDIAFNFPFFQSLTALVSKIRVSEKRLNFDVVANYSTRKAQISMSTVNSDCKISSKFRNAEFASLGSCYNQSQASRQEEPWMQGNGQDLPTNFTVTIDSAALHNLFSGFADSTSRGLTFGICDKEFALLALNTHEVDIMYLLPHHQN